MPIGAAALASLVHSQPWLLCLPVGTAWPYTRVPHPGYCTCTLRGVACPSLSCWQMLQPSPAWHGLYSVLALVHASSCCGLSQLGLPADLAYTLADECYSLALPGPAPLWARLPCRSCSLAGPQPAPEPTGASSALSPNFCMCAGGYSA